MIDDDTDEAGVPDSDPRHIDPAGDLADAVEAGPGLEATVRIVRALLDEEK